ncbi:hypothetical protein D3C72_1403350 [compost metagenome]
MTDSGRGEEGGRAAGHLQPELDHGLGVGEVHRLERRAGHDARAQGLFGLQLGAQLVLAEHDDLDELVRVGLEVEQLAHELELGALEQLGLVDDQDDDAAGLVLGDEELVEAGQGLLLGAGRRDAELAADGDQQLVLGGVGRVRQVGHRVLLGVVQEVVEQVAAHGGLAHAHVAVDDGQALAVLHQVEALGDRRAVLGADVQVTRVGRQAERQFLVSGHGRGGHGVPPKGTRLIP